MTKWISVEERLPDNNQFTLLYCLLDMGLNIRIGEFGSDIKIYHDLGITHWMPLPEPPV
jgi:hypothetical protein